MIKLQGKITNISDLVHIERKNIPDLYKKIITIVTSDQQKLFVEIRNKTLAKINDINVNDIVEITILFQGSEKNGKNYNNILVHDIIKK